MTESFPRQQARTRHFSLGVPRNFAIAADGSRVAFLRTRDGADQSTCLWVLDVASREERLVVDPRTVSDGGTGEIPLEERARRERARESSGGIVRFSADTSLARALFDLAGRLYVVDLETQALTELATGGVAIDPNLDPTGVSVAYVEHGALYAAGLDGATPVCGHFSRSSREPVCAGRAARGARRSSSAGDSTHPAFAFRCTAATMRSPGSSRLRNSPRSR